MINKTIKKVWIVEEGIAYTDFYGLHSVHYTKKSAEAQARNDGFKFNKSESIFLNCNKIQKKYRRIYSENIIEVLANPKCQK